MALVTIGAIAALYVICLLVYRLFLHPLAKYPGPISYKLSGWPLVWQAYRGDRHIWHLKDHEKYGSIVRIAPNTLSFSTASALSTIHGPRSANVQKGEFYKTFDIAAGAYSSFTETDRNKHAAKRRWLSPVFSAESLTKSEPVIINIIKRYCETLRPRDEEEWGFKWNASILTTYLGLDIMGALVFGADFKSVQEEENRPMANSILPASKFLNWLSYLPLAVLVRPLLRTRLFEIVGGEPVVDNNRLIDYGSAEVQNRLASVDKNIDSERTDFLSQVVHAEDKSTGWHPTVAELNAEALNMMNAGADPYSSIMAAVIFYLVHNDNALQKATTEVRSTFASQGDIHTGGGLNSCVYLYACIEEALRRTAGVPSHLPRTVLKGGMSIDGHHLPEGTVVGTPAYAIHHNPEYFPDPWKFLPERWLDLRSESGSSSSFASRKAFTPFGIGTRQCAGMKLGYLQLKLTLAHLLYKYDLRLAPDEPHRGCGRPGMGIGRERVDEFQMWDALGFERDGPMVQVRLARE